VGGNAIPEISQTETVSVILLEPFNSLHNEMQLDRDGSTLDHELPVRSKDHRTRETRKANVRVAQIHLMPPKNITQVSLHLFFRTARGGSPRSGRQILTMQSPVKQHRRGPYSSGEGVGAASKTLERCAPPSREQGNSENAAAGRPTECLHREPW
jgi:hypothetical protein